MENNHKKKVKINKKIAVKLKIKNSRTMISPKSLMIWQAQEYLCVDFDPHKLHNRADDRLYISKCKPGFIRWIHLNTFTQM